MKLSNIKENLKQKKHPLKINLHIGGIMVIFCLIIFLALWLFQIVFLEDFYRGSKANAIREASSKLKNIVTQYDLGNRDNDAILEEDISSIARQYDTNIIIVTDQIIINASTNIRDNFIGMITLSDLQEITTIVETNGGEMWSYTSKNDFPENNDFPEALENLNHKRDSRDTQLIYNGVVSDYSGNKALIVMSCELQSVSVIKSTLKLQIWTIFAIILFFSLIITWVLSRFIARPIIQITDRAKKLANGDYTPNFNEKGYREIAELNDTLNYACDELSKVETLQKELIANVSHDLRTPLTLISGYGEMMRDIPGENNTENVQVIIDEANRLSSMVNNILDVSKLDVKWDKGKPEVFCITSLLKTAQANYQSFLQSKGYHISLEQNEDVYVNADPTQIQQALYNLLNNAVNYTSDQKNIWLKQSIEDNMVRIDVIDDGEGVAEEHIKDIWNRYYRDEKNHRRAIVGSGLGLSIVKKVVEQYNGICAVQSKLNEGCDFYFKLPIVIKPEIEEI